MKQAPPHKIDFDKALRVGSTAYDGKVGDWWASQCNNAVHHRAYRAIADRLREHFGKREPRLIVEYACGPGQLLVRLARRFPKTKLIGIDGSAQMLAVAAQRLKELGGGAAQHVELWESRLPDFNLPQWEADAVVFIFPNICPGPDEQAHYDRHGAKHKLDYPIAKALAAAREADPEEETIFDDDPSDMVHSLMDAKVVARNLRGLVKKGGVCLRADYATGPRSALTDLVNMRLDFEIGAMAREFKGKRPEPVFKSIDSRWRRSKVIEDVYHQTGDEGDKVGGYLIGLLRAI